jgi:hypothetical protein
MIRARAAFKVCRFADDNKASIEGGEDHRQLYAEDEISEDIELGTRMHASGYRSVFVNEKLATGEVYIPFPYTSLGHVSWSLCSNCN